MVTADALRALSPEGSVRTWNIDNCLLYALGVGAGSFDPTSEIGFTTENSAGVTPRAVPTYGIILCGGGPELLAPAGVRQEDVLLVSETLELFGEIPTEGTVRVEHGFGAIESHARGLVVEAVNTASLDGAVLCRTTARTLVVQDSQPHSVERPVRRATVPENAVTWQFVIPPNQALLYRLTAGRNPLHSDPAIAAEAGHAVPILHGRCTSGFVARELIAHKLGGDPTRLTELTARFLGPVFPGDTLELAVTARTDGGDYLLYRAADQDVVLKGSFRSVS